MINPRFSSLLAVLAIALPLHAAKPTPTPVASISASAVTIPPLPTPTASPVATTPTALSASPLEDAIAAIQKVAAERLAQANAGETVPNRFDWSSAEAELDQIKTATLSGNANDAKNSLRNLTRRIKSEELKKLLENLGTAIDAQKNVESDARSAKYVQKINEVSSAALKADTSKAIDPLFEQLQNVEDELNQLSSDNRLSRLRTQVNQLQNFLRSWQDLLDTVNSGDNSPQARSTVTNFRANYWGGSNIPPRADLNARLKTLRAKLGASTSVNDTLATLTVDNVAAIQQQLSESNDSNSGWNNEANERNSLIMQLESFLTADQALKTGNIDEALGSLRVRFTNFYGGARGSIYYPTLNRIRNAWVIRSLPALTGLNDLDAAKADEPASAYIQRLLLAADKAENWDRALPLARVNQALDITAVPAQLSANTSKPNPELAIANYQRGQLLEKAGQTDAAIDSYVEALKQGGLPKLQEKLIARLRELPAKAK